MNDAPPLAPPHALDAFAEKLAASLADDSFVRLVFSGPRHAENGLERVLGRCIHLKGVPHLSLTWRYTTRDVVKNVPLAAATKTTLSLLKTEFRSALLCTTERDWQISCGKGKEARLIRHRATQAIAPARDHDQSRSSFLDDSARDWLGGLKVTDHQGHPRPAMTDKYRQINRYLEILSHLGKDCLWDPALPREQPSKELVVFDMGCGKGYLTFGVWHLLRRMWKLNVQVRGVEARPDLIAETNRLAQEIGATDLTFSTGTIETVNIPQADVLIALHACDTATDHAIRRGIDAAAQLILVAPCCHKEVRPKLSHPQPLAPLLRHGLLEERLAEWVTDGLRALFLEWAGYETKVFEFVSSEHTPKNLMISAVRTRAPFADPAVRSRIEELKAFFGVATHTLDPLLARPA